MALTFPIPTRQELRDKLADRDHRAAVQAIMGSGGDPLVNAAAATRYLKHMTGWDIDVPLFRDVWETL